MNFKSFFGFGEKPAPVETSPVSNPGVLKPSEDLINAMNTPASEEARERVKRGEAAGLAAQSKTNEEEKAEGEKTTPVNTLGQI